MKRLFLWATAALVALTSSTALVSSTPKLTALWSSGMAFQDIEEGDLTSALSSLGVEGDVGITESGVVVTSLQVDVERFFEALGEPELLSGVTGFSQCSLAIDCEQGCLIGSQLLAARGAAAAARLPHPVLITVGEGVVAYLTYHLTTACLECCERNGCWCDCRREIMDEARNISDRLCAKAIRYLEEGVIDPGPLRAGRCGMGMPIMVP